MKIIEYSVEEEFKPIEFKILFETKEEFKDFYARMCIHTKCIDDIYHKKNLISNRSSILRDYISKIWYSREYNEN